MRPDDYDRLSPHQRDTFVSDGEGILEHELEQHVIEEGDEWVLCARV